MFFKMQLTFSGPLETFLVTTIHQQIKAIADNCLNLHQLSTRLKKKLVQITYFAFLIHKTTKGLTTCNIVSICC